MSGRTIQRRVRAARQFFRRLDAAVLTTFTFNADFFEENVLPTLLDIDDGEPRRDRGRARRAQVHEALRELPVSVFYDPSVARLSAGAFRYVACPVPLRGRRFHPKNVILAGVGRDGRDWI